MPQDTFHFAVDIQIKLHYPNAWLIKTLGLHFWEHDPGQVQKNYTEGNQHPDRVLHLHPWERRGIIKRHLRKGKIYVISSSIYKWIYSPGCCRIAIRFSLSLSNLLLLARLSKRGITSNYKVRSLSSSGRWFLSLVESGQLQTRISSRIKS